jgi:hypothetical protein
VPQELTGDLGKLIEYNTSCAPVFVQRAGIAALNEGEPVIARTVARFHKARDFLVKELNAIGGVTADSLEFCKQLVREDRLAEGAAALTPRNGAWTRESAPSWCAAFSMMA